MDLKDLVSEAQRAGVTGMTPGCMTTCDARARQVEEYFTGQLAEVATFEWTTAGQVLVVDNRRALHSRAAVADGDMDRELIGVAFR
jgi:hypothetical protein